MVQVLAGPPLATSTAHVNLTLDSDDEGDDGEGKKEKETKKGKGKGKGKAEEKVDEPGKEKKGKGKQKNNDEDDNGDDDDESRAPGKKRSKKDTGKKGPIEDHTFYDLPANASEQVIQQQLRYQVRSSGMGRYPDPGVGSRFDFDLLSDDLEIDEVQEELIEKHEKIATHKQLRCRAFEESLQDHWIKNPTAEAALLRGFPMMEEVVFYRSANDKGCASDCYWKAVAQQMYGYYGYSTRVKAEHLEYFTAVLQDKRHPRHDDYRLLNKSFVNSTVSFNAKSAPTRVNLYQQLRVPRVWTSDSMFQVTADLYNLFIVTYRLDSREATVPSKSKKSKSAKKKNLYARAPIIYGSYNSRHVFFLFVDNNHYQPMVPNDFSAGEFHFPRPTFESTYGYENTTRKTGKASSLSTSHPWRRNNTLAKLLLEDGAPSSITVSDGRALRAVLTGNPIGDGDIK